VSPAKFADKVELPAGWTVLRFSHLDEKDARRATHGKWVALTRGRNTIYRVVRYSVTLPASDIVLDWAGWIDLQGRLADAPDQIQIAIRTPRLCEYLLIPFKHIDPGYRMSAWLGAISVGLGVLSVILSLKS
jgi:hypothetical protein